MAANLLKQLATLLKMLLIGIVTRIASHFIVD